jgi:hypothetical protein
VRWFVALYDYNPTTMSPNPDACEEELPFSENDTIKVLKEIIHGKYQYIIHHSIHCICGNGHEDIHSSGSFKRKIILFTKVS